MMDLHTFCRGCPMCEVHVHFEGTLEDNQAELIASRNGIKLTRPRILDMRPGFQYSSLQDFLDPYYEACSVLLYENDFRDVAYEFLKKQSAGNVRHTDMFFDPQAHISRKNPATGKQITFGTVIRGIRKGIKDAHRDFGVTCDLVMCILRHLTEKEAIECFTQAVPYLKWIKALGLDSGERGNPPSKFKRVFALARACGLPVRAHAGEEGPATYIWQTLKVLKGTIIDHGVACVDEEDLMLYLRDNQIPLTMCSLSSLRLRVINTLAEYPIGRLLKFGLLVTLNSDDPAYFGGYLKDVLIATAEAQNLTIHDIYKLARNSWLASYRTDAQKAEGIAELDAFYKLALTPELTAVA
jgi:adenosine deaminase